MERHVGDRVIRSPRLTDSATVVTRTSQLRRSVRPASLPRLLCKTAPAALAAAFSRLRLRAGQRPTLPPASGRAGTSHRLCGRGGESLGGAGARNRGGTDQAPLGKREAVGLCRCKAITKVVRGNVFVPLRLRGHGKQFAAIARTSAEFNLRRGPFYLQRARLRLVSGDVRGNTLECYHLRSRPAACRRPCISVSGKTHQAQRSFARPCSGLGILGRRNPRHGL